MMGVVERFADSEFVGNKLVVSYRQNDRFLPRNLYSIYYYPKYCNLVASKCFKNRHKTAEIQLTC